MNRTVYQLWRNLGPYHLVRAEAAANQLAQYGIDLIAVQLAHGEATRDWRIGDIDDCHFEIITLAEDPSLTLDRGTPSMWRQLRTLLENIPPAGVCIAGYDRHEMRSALNWCRRKDIPSVLMSETKWNDSPRPRWKQMVLRHLIGKAGAGQVSGSLAADFLQRLGMANDRIFRPYGVVDNASFAAASEARFANGNEPYFLVCCRLVESRKNLSTLFAAYATYRKRTPSPWPLVICGDGQDLECYRRQVAELGIADAVRFAGFQQAASLVDFYAGAGALVHPARQESWGLVVNEAMAAGLPVLVSDACGCAFDLVSDGENGFTFAPDDGQRLADLLACISEMKVDQRIHMGQKSSARIVGWSPQAFGEAQVAALVAAGMEIEPAATRPAIAAEVLLPC